MKQKKIVPFFVFILEWNADERSGGRLLRCKTIYLASRRIHGSQRNKYRTQYQKTEHASNGWLRASPSINTFLGGAKGSRVSRKKSLVKVLLVRLLREQLSNYNYLKTCHLLKVSCWQYLFLLSMLWRCFLLFLYNCERDNTHSSTHTWCTCNCYALRVCNSQTAHHFAHLSVLKMHACECEMLTLCNCVTYKKLVISCV